MTGSAIIAGASISLAFLLLPQLGDKPRRGPSMTSLLFFFPDKALIYAGVSDGHRQEPDQIIHISGAALVPKGLAASPQKTRSMRQVLVRTRLTAGG